MLFKKVQKVNTILKIPYTVKRLTDWVDTLILSLAFNSSSFLLFHAKPVTEIVHDFSELGLHIPVHCNDCLTQTASLISVLYLKKLA